MTERDKFAVDELRRRIFGRAGWRCEACGMPVCYYGTQQIAHRIPQRMARKYGKDIIHHPLNLVATCSLKCNDKVSISNHPVQIAELVSQIKAALAA